MSNQPGLSKETIDIIKATVPAVAENAEAITSHFYPLMFSEFPEVKAYFNQSHQREGTQPKALAGAVVAYAANIENLEVLTDAVNLIVHKHASLDIRPEQYSIVGGCLLKAIKAVLGDAATEEVLAAWGEAYWQLADLLIDAEEAVYQANESKAGGWRGERAFKVARKVKESEVITSFYLEPVDGNGVPEYVPGQYIGLVMQIDGETTRRNYSLSDAPGKDYLRISVKREQDGLVSNYLHDGVNEGDELSVIPPVGDFVLNDNEKPLVLVTGGVGITPAMSMLNHCSESGRSIKFIHAAINSQHHSFKDEVDAVSEGKGNVEVSYVYEKPTEQCQADHVGFIDEGFLAEKLGSERDVELYFLGPKPFMRMMYQASKSLGIPENNVHFEFFGPLEDLESEAGQSAAA